MAKTNYTELSNQLAELLKSAPRNSESQNATACHEAQQLVWGSDLSEEERTTVYHAIGSSANPSGYYCDNNGIQAGIDALTALEPATPSTRFNLSNLQNLTADGAIFSVKFIRRTDGKIRKMVCRLGVKKHLKGGSKAYSTKKHNLLTVFDMEKAGYRSIPVDAIQSLSVHGQTFSFV